jgi:hypothetical protein
MMAQDFEVIVATYRTKRTEVNNAFQVRQSQAWWCLPVIPELRRLRQED